MFPKSSTRLKENISISFAYILNTTILLSTQLLTKIG